MPEREIKSGGVQERNNLIIYDFILEVFLAKKLEASRLCSYRNGLTADFVSPIMRATLVSSQGDRQTSSSNGGTRYSNWVELWAATLRYIHDGIGKKSE